MFFNYLRHHLLLLFKGMAMGAADVVPGVSGGTIAFITGIYEELIDSIRKIDFSAVRVLFKQGVAACWNHINGNFLLTVLCGILISLLSLSKLIQYLLEAHSILVWSFFFGLVCASIVHLAKQLGPWNGQLLVALLVGTIVSVLIATVKPAELPNHWWMFTIAGAIAICAMILPGISGSYILVLMGMYSTFLQAISEFQVGLLLCFAGGCALGLTSFSHVLSWLLHRFHQQTIGTLTGFLIGSLTLIWPWKLTLSTYLNRHGEEVPLEQENVLPWQFQDVTGNDSQLLGAIILVFVGIVLVLALERLGKKSQ